MTTYTINKEHNGIEIAFDTIPSVATRNALKADGFRWHKVKKVWYAKQTAERLSLAESLTGKEETADYTTFESGEGRYIGYTGSNNYTWSDSKELKAAILNEFKKNGIKATARIGRGGYTTSITFTITAPKDQQITLDEYFENTRTQHRAWYYRNDGSCVYRTDLWDLTNGETDEIIKETCRREYEGDASAAVKESFKSFVKQIVTSFNRDNSDLMTDYFDRDFYDWYDWKLA